jgi:hypothetical protein
MGKGKSALSCTEMVGRVGRTHSNLGGHEGEHSQIVIELPISFEAAEDCPILLTKDQLV